MTNKSNWVWVVAGRLELEENGNQTERVYVEVFENKDDAIKYALREVRPVMKRFGYGTEGDKEYMKQELAELDAQLRQKQRFYVSGLVQLTDSDNLVVELTHKKVRRHNGK